VVDAAANSSVSRAVSDSRCLFPAVSIIVGRAVLGLFVGGCRAGDGCAFSRGRRFQGVDCNNRRRVNP
jgi:hypothetical protein